MYNDSHTTKQNKSSIGLTWTQNKTTAGRQTDRQTTGSHTVYYYLSIYSNMLELVIMYIQQSMEWLHGE